jgi:hypothetical protein
MLKKSGAVFLGIHPHAAELIDIERSAKTPYALLFEDGGATVFTLDEDVADEKERRENYETHNCGEKVNEALYVTLNLVHTVKYVSVFEFRHRGVSLALQLLLLFIL